jgi:argininosuccinate synthase
MHPPLISCRYVEIGVESGLAVSVNGKRLSPASLPNELTTTRLVGGMELAKLTWLKTDLLV